MHRTDSSNSGAACRPSHAICSAVIACAPTDLCVAAFFYPFFYPNWFFKPVCQAGFSGGLVVDYPHSTRAKKFFLVLMVGPSSVASMPQVRPPVR
jgi:hypothetical protein